MKLLVITESPERLEAIKKIANRVRFYVYKRGKPWGLAISKALNEYNHLANKHDIGPRTINHYFNPPKLDIKWQKPDFSKETDEYFKNDPTRRFLAKRHIAFSNEQQLIEFLSHGKLEQLDKKDLWRHGILNLSTKPEDFVRELQDPDYRLKYHKKVDKLLKERKVTFDAPILIKFPDTYYGFSGNRRANLAWNNEIPVKFWVVEVKSAKQLSLFK